MLTFASPQAAEYGKPEDTERRVGGRSGATRDGNRKTHRGLQGKQEGLLGHYFSPEPPHVLTNSNRRLGAGFVHSDRVERGTPIAQPPHSVGEARHGLRVFVAKPAVGRRACAARMD